jgi:hypothetical protein
VSVKKGKLFVLAAGKFDALATIDKFLPDQQNLTSLPISVFVLDAPSTELPYLLPLVPILEVALASHDPGASVLLRTET